MKKNENVIDAPIKERPIKERYEEWRVRFELNSGELFKEKMIRLTAALEEHTVLTLNTGRKFGAIDSSTRTTVMYFRPGEELPVGGQEILDSK